jgi:hypothetical protein
MSLSRTLRKIKRTVSKSLRPYSLKLEGLLPRSATPSDSMYTIRCMRSLIRCLKWRKRKKIMATTKNIMRWKSSQMKRMKRILSTKCELY